MLNFPYRPASKADAHQLAELVNMAGEGMPVYLWSRMLEPGEDVWDVGRRRAQRDEGGFSWRNAVVREDKGKAIAALIGYPLPDEPEPIDYDDMPPMFVPLQQLEDLAPGTWYVNVLATYPEYRGKGFGGELLAIAEEFARSEQRHGLSIIVSDGNCGAVRLYERNGYKRVDERPMVKDEWENAGENWILLTKPV